MKRKIYEWIPSFIAVLMTIGVMTMFRACEAGEDGMWMNCHYVQMDVFYLGIVITLLSVIRIFLNRQLLKWVVCAAELLLVIITMLLPGTLMHMCMMETMRCHALMKPFVFVMCGAFVVAEAILIVVEGKVSRKEQTA